MVSTSARTSLHPLDFCQTGGLGKTLLPQSASYASILTNTAGTNQHLLIFSCTLEDGHSCPSSYRWQILRASYVQSAPIFCSLCVSKARHRVAAAGFAQIMGSDPNPRY